MTFRSTDVELATTAARPSSGDLTIRGVSRPITAEGSTRADRGSLRQPARRRSSSHATIDRSGWGMSWQLPLPDGGDALGWEVELTADLELVRAG